VSIEGKEILKGVKPGEKVVVFGLYGLKDGSPVEVLSELTGDEQEQEAR
jgi:hypothetical protein